MSDATRTCWQPQLQSLKPNPVHKHQKDANKHASPKTAAAVTPCRARGIANKHLQSCAKHAHAFLQRAALRQLLTHDLIEYDSIKRCAGSHLAVAHHSSLSQLSLHDV